MSYSEITSDGDRMFSPVYHDVWQQQLKHMRASDFKVYFALLAHTTQKDRTWFMSIAELAEDAGVAPSTASAAKDRLMEAGLVEQSWRYRDENGDYHLTDTRPPPRMQGKNVYTVSVRPGNVGTENRGQSDPGRYRKSVPIDTENRYHVDTENRKQTVAPSPEPPPEPLPPLAPQGEAGGPRQQALAVEPSVEPPAEPKPKRETQRAELLPEGWLPDRAVAEKLHRDFPHLDLAAEHEDFTDYWNSVPASRGRKRDWNATWRIWMRKQGQQRRGYSPRSSQAAPSRADEKAMGYFAVAEELGRQGASGHGFGGHGNVLEP